MKRRVFVVRGMKITTGKKRPHLQSHGETGRTLPAPAQDDRGCPSRDENLLDNLSAGYRVGPLRPWVRGKTCQPGDAVRVLHAGRIALGAQRITAFCPLHLGVEAIDQHHASARRRGRRQQQRVVAPGANARNCTAGKPAEAVGLQPFRRLRFRGDRLDHGRIIAQICVRWYGKFAGAFVGERPGLPIGVRRVRLATPEHNARHQPRGQHDAIAEKVHCLRGQRQPQD